MKSFFCVLMTIAMTLFFAACSAPSPVDEAPSTSPVAEPSESDTPSTSPLILPTAAPLQSEPPLPTFSFVPTTDIPDVVFSDNDTAIGNCSIYEDDEYIYYSGYSILGINRISKSDRSVTLIENYPSDLAYFDGILYYSADRENSEDDTYQSIWGHNLQSGKKEDIISFENYMEDITVYNGKLYYIYNRSFNSFVYDLYSVNLDGTENNLIRTSVSTFKIYKDNIYYMETTPSGYYEPTSLFKCSLSGSNKEKLLDNVYPEFEICNGKLFCIEAGITPESEPRIMLDLDTGTKTEMLPYSSFALLGQYLIFEIDCINNCIRYQYLYAYDTTSGNTYSLISLDTALIMLSASRSGVYFYSWDEGGVHLTISCVRIINGKASLSEVTTITDTSVFDPSTVAAKEFSDDTVIIADSNGIIIGGYSDGNWISHIEAGAYCEDSLKFYCYNLAGFVETTESPGAEYENDFSYYWSWTVDGNDGDYSESGIYGFDPYYDYYEDPEDPCDGLYMYTAGPERLPETEVLSDFSEVLPVIQQMIDSKLGNGVTEAQIRCAVKADIDNDGEAEIIVSADNSYEHIYDSEYANLYTIACIIESDGTVCVIEDYYSAKNTTDEGFSDAISVMVQNIFDIDGGGTFEIVLNCEEWESWWTEIYKYDGHTVTKVISSGSGC